MGIDHRVSLNLELAQMPVINILPPKRMHVTGGGQTNVMIQICTRLPTERYSPEAKVPPRPLKTEKCMTVVSKANMIITTFIVQDRLVVVFSNIAREISYFVQGKR